MSKINDLQAVRDKLAEDWAPWARRREQNQGYPTKTVEYDLMRFGCEPPKATGSPPTEENPTAQAIEAVVKSMPNALMEFIRAEFIYRIKDGKISNDDDAERLTREDKARLTHTSKTKYYAQLDIALAWLHGKI